MTSSGFRFPARHSIKKQKGKKAKTEAKKEREKLKAATKNKTAIPEK